MSPPTWDDAGSPAALPLAHDRSSIPLPAGFGLTLDGGTRRLANSVLLGGSPLRLLRLSSRATDVAARWEAGEPLRDSASERRLARRLVSAGTHVPRPAQSDYTADGVTVVIPVRDRPAQLDALLSALTGLRCLVVDDASADPALTVQVAQRSGAAYILLDQNCGPSGARNAGLGAATTALVAFIDSDCVPSAEWLGPLLGHFNDPLVAAVAPRIAPAETADPSALSRYEAVRSSLDRGSTPGVVRPMSRIPYVPSAALVVRRSVTAQPFFDERLRGGEDVDLVWRLGDAGWDVRYEPASVVFHSGPQTMTEWLARRSFYGTSAAPLSQRHPDAMAPLQTSVWSAAAWGLLAVRRPVLAGAAVATSIAVLTRRLRGLVDEPVATAARIAGGGTVRAALPALGGLTRAWAPGMLLALGFRRTRRAAAFALLAPAISDWQEQRNDLDPVTYAALHVADDVAYGVGVWRGCLRSRTLRPLIPRVVLHSRTWSPATLQSQLGSDAPHS
jgi:mycofactocin glycosyltransferase